MLLSYFFFKVLTYLAFLLIYFGFFRGEDGEACFLCRILFVFRDFLESLGVVTDFGGGGLDIYGQETLASNGRIHEEMVGVLGRR